MSPLMTLSRFGAEILRVRRVGVMIEVTLLTPDASVFHADDRLRRVEDIVRRSLAPFTAAEPQPCQRGLVFAVPLEREGEAAAGMSSARRRAIDHLDAPLAPRATDKALGISARERLRWYKDGRLPTCGRSPLGCGNHRVQVPRFPIAAIAAIASDPGIVEAWRQSDRQAWCGSDDRRVQSGHALADRDAMGQAAEQQAERRPQDDLRSE